VASAPLWLHKPLSPLGTRVPMHCSSPLYVALYTWWWPVHKAAMAVGLLGCWAAVLLGCWPVGLLDCWAVGLLGCWAAGLLGCWAAGLLGCWAVGLLGCWVAGLLGCWAAGLLSCWAVGMLGCWAVGLLKKKANVAIRFCGCNSKPCFKLYQSQRWTPFFRDVSTCDTVQTHRRFGWIYYHCLQDRRISLATFKDQISCNFYIKYFACSLSVPCRN
jgi:hypothetical protein